MYLTLLLVFIGSAALGASILLRRQAPQPIDLGVHFVEAGGAQEAAVSPNTEQRAPAADGLRPRAKSKQRREVPELPLSSDKAGVSETQTTSSPRPVELEQQPVVQPTIEPANLSSSTDDEEQNVPNQTPASNRRPFFVRLLDRLPGRRNDAAQNEQDADISTAPESAEEMLPPLRGARKDADAASVKPVISDEGTRVHAVEVPHLSLDTLEREEVEDDEALAVGLIPLEEEDESVPSPAAVSTDERTATATPEPVHERAAVLIPVWAGAIGIDRWPTSPDALLAAIEDALAGSDLQRRGAVAEAFSSEPDVRRTIVTVLADATPAPETIVPLSFAMLEHGDEEARMLAVGLLFAAGLTDEAAAQLGASADIDGILAFHAVSSWGIEGACTWLVDRGLSPVRAGQLARSADSVMRELTGADVA